LEVVRTIAELRQHTSRWRIAGQTIGLIPTMGALHKGHLSLIKLAQGKCDRVIATIFVNPRQFLPNEDFDEYPRNEESDIQKLIEMGVDLLFAPKVSEMYRPDASTTVVISKLTDCLCATSRPGFFDGVGTVVTKLLIQALPDLAIFGEKDYQQLLVIKRLTRDLDIPVEIIGAPTIREADGLAVSSRNVYLSQTNRETASKVFEILKKTATAIALRNDVLAACKEARKELILAGLSEIDYFEARHSETLELIQNFENNGRLFAAVWLGSTRLIDNLEIKEYTD
jgi:pantoate--beta-alanine ligase|tara:strand:- start:4699 stop:5550 length:852 start_codon:yes stop_codon:yes gene_type:complete